MTSPPPFAAGTSPRFPSARITASDVVSPRYIEVGGCRLSVAQYAPGLHMPLHAHDFDGVSIVLAGELVEETRDRHAVAEAGCVVTKPRGTLHENRFGPGGAALLSIAVPPGSTVHDRILTWQWHRSFESYRLAIAVLISLLAGDLARCRESVIELLAPGTQRPRADRSGWVTRARDLLDGVQGVRVDEIAADLQVHPVSLTRAFRQSFGCSPSVYRRHVRLLRAARMMARSDASLSEIAHRAGFADHSHFSREFSRELGAPPSWLRRVVGADPDGQA